MRLGYGRLLGFYYGHVGYYVSQLHFHDVLFVTFLLMLLCGLSDGTGVLPDVASAAKTISELLLGLSYIFLYFLPK